MDTADDSRELTDGRRELAEGRRPACGSTVRDVDRDGKFMTPSGRLSVVVYVRRIGVLNRAGMGASVWSEIVVDLPQRELCFRRG